MKARLRRIEIAAYLHHYQIERPPDWSEIFGREAPRRVEIGSGLGEFLVEQAAQKRDCDFIGIEYDWKRVKKILNRIYLYNQGQPQALSNVRVLQLDARTVLERLFAPRSVEQMYCLFPCPWPKTSHIKHRLFSQDFLRLLNSRLNEQGILQLVTDFYPYVEWIQEQLPDTGLLLKQRIIDPQFGTKFEKKWRAQGQSQFYEMVLSKNQHCDVPLKEDVQLQVYFVENFDPVKFDCPDATGEISVICKDFIFDAAREKGMLRLVVAEPELTQQVWLMLRRAKGVWCLSKAEGHTVLPTPGVAFALQHVYEQLAQDAVEHGGRPTV